MERRPIALICAMAGEAKPVIDALGLLPVAPPAVAVGLPFRYWSGRRGNTPVVAAVSGTDPRFGVDNIGLEPAALAAFAAIRGFTPALIINAGTAGSFAARGANVGDVYVSGGPFRFHDHRIPLGAFAQYGRGDFQGVDVTALATKLGLKTGGISSGSSLDYTERDLAEFQANGATLKEMEAAAIAWVCTWTATRFFAVKAVTNLLDVTPDSPDAFTHNFATATAALTRVVPTVLDETLASKLHRES
ncbi:MAG TPA: 5'-methylthioadenosine nucleosidase [Candidatus Binatia bacterium]|nr:5'-methylthioadenosine nucleosidase [Candidatus Binatia bacterium]